MSKPKIEKVTLTFQVMRVNDEKYFIGSNGLLSPVPDTAHAIIAELEVSMNRVLNNKLKSKTDDNIISNNNDSTDSLSG